MIFPAEVQICKTKKGSPIVELGMKKTCLLGLLEQPLRTGLSSF